MMIRNCGKQAKRRGAAMVEMAMVLPLFFMVVLGIIEFGRAMMVSQMVTNSAREATRLAIIDGQTNATVTTWVTGFMSQAAGVAANDVTVTITVTPATGNPNPANQVVNAKARDLVTVNVSVPFNKVSYIPGSYLNGRNLHARSAMRHE